MKRTRAIRVLRILNVAAVLAVGVFAYRQSGGAAEQDEKGVLVLNVIDAATKKPVPARVEVLDSEKRGHVSPDGVPIGGD